MLSHSNRSCCFALVVALGLALGSANVAPAHAAALPPALVRLIPADPIAVVVAPSIDEFTRDVRSLIALFDEETAANFDPVTMLGDDMARFAAVVDLTRPLALAVRLAPGAPMPLISTVLPLRDPSLDLEGFRARTGMEALAVRDGHVVVGSDTYYEPGETNPALILDLPDADLAARLDLRSLFEQMGPMLDMVISMAFAPSVPDSAADDGAAPGAAPPLDVDEVLELVATIRDGMRTIELAVDVDGVMVELHTGVDLDPDGPLALGEQPSREAAIDLLRRLPEQPGSIGYMASAIGLDPFMELFERAARLASDASGGESVYSVMGPSGAFHDQVMEVIGDLYAPYWEPNAWTLGSEDGRILAAGIIESATPQMLVDDLFLAMSSLQTTGFRVEREAGSGSAGEDVRRYRVDYDLGALLDQVSPEGRSAADEEQIQAISDWLDTVVPVIDVATRPGQVLVATAYDEHSGMEALRARAAEPGDIPAAMAEVVEWAGPQARGWMHLDLTRLLALISGLLADLPQSEDDRFEMPTPEALASLPAMPVRGAVSLQRSWLRGRLRMDLLAVASFVEILQANED